VHDLDLQFAADAVEDLRLNAIMVGAGKLELARPGVLPVLRVGQLDVDA
jgi:hypothetical protein